MHESEEVGFERSDLIHASSVLHSCSRSFEASTKALGKLSCRSACGFGDKAMCAEG